MQGRDGGGHGGGSPAESCIVEQDGTDMVVSLLGNRPKEGTRRFAIQFTLRDFCGNTATFIRDIWVDANKKTTQCLAGAFVRSASGEFSLNGELPDAPDSSRSGSRSSVDSTREGRHADTTRSSSSGGARKSTKSTKASKTKASKSTKRASDSGGKRKAGGAATKTKTAKRSATKTTKRAATKQDKGGKGKDKQRTNKHN